LTSPSFSTCEPASSQISNLSLRDALTISRRRGIAHSHPGRVLLRHEALAGSFVGAPTPVRTGQAHVRTRGGCSYDTRWWQVCLEEHRLGANGAGTHSHPRRVLLRREVVAGLL